MNLPILLLLTSPWWGTIQREARQHHVDPVLVQAIVEHESHGVADVVSTKLGCIGLMQICPSTLRVCQDDATSLACREECEKLLIGAYNIQRGVERLASWRTFCLSRTGHAETWHVLSGFAGADNHTVLCGQRKRHGHYRDVKPHKVVQQIIEIANRMRRHHK